MRTSNGDVERAIQHCQRHIERNRAELERREGSGQDVTRLRERLKTLQMLRAEHEAERARLRSAR